MKILKPILMALSILLFASLSPAATLPATITYAPDTANLTIPAGAQDSITVKFDVINTTVPTYALWPADKMSDGNLPLGWIVPMSFKFLVPGQGVTSTLTISVPPGTSSGVYSGHLIAKAQSSHNIAQPGTGILISVTIPPDCSGVGAFAIDWFGPSILWPPDHGMHEVTVSGTLTLPNGCSLKEAGYAVTDEYNEYTSVGTMTVNSAGSFTLSLPLEAWREGTDKDGRQYTVILYATDEAGIGSSDTFTVVVPHDRGK